MEEVKNVIFGFREVKGSLPSMSEQGVKAPQSLRGFISQVSVQLQFPLYVFRPTWLDCLFLFM